MGRRPKQPTRPADPTQAASSLPSRASVLTGLGLVALAVLAYLPALRAGWIWDDPQYVVNNPTLRSAAGLWAIWTRPLSLPQWYPLVHTTYWVEYRLWGLRPAGYHATNVLLHGVACVGLWRLLVRLRVPGAIVAAALFAAHPVMVESVAWVTERKNVLSGAFYFAAFLAYLRFRPGAAGESDDAAVSNLKSEISDSRFQISPRGPWYALALLLFLAALLSKTVTASLPAAILVVTWWKAGRIDWRRDLPPLLPFFAVGAGLGAATGWIERTHVGASGAEWDYAPTALGEVAARAIIAGRAVWFYAGKLAWPTDLMFIYPRWAIDPSAAWQWAFPLSLAVIVAVLFVLRGRIGRGPLAAVLLFIGTLFPALGFVNVFPHRYSFVADHFQYHAAPALFALVAAGVARLSGRLPARAVAGVASAVVLVLAGLTFARCFAYRDAATLFADNWRKHPSWMVALNLGHEAANAGDADRAGEWYRAAVRLGPDVADPHFDAGSDALRRGDLASAERLFARAVELNPAFLPAWLGLGRIAESRGDDASAERSYAAAIGSASNASAEMAMADLYQRTGRSAEAVGHYRRAVELRPGDFDARQRLATLLLADAARSPDVASARRVLGEALVHLRAAVSIRPDAATAWAQLGTAAGVMGLTDEAARAYAEALRLDRTLEAARVGLRRIRG